MRRRTMIIGIVAIVFILSMCFAGCATQDPESVTHFVDHVLKDEVRFTIVSYENDSKTIYKYDNGKMEYISDDGHIFYEVLDNHEHKDYDEVIKYTHLYDDSYKVEVVSIGEQPDLVKSISELKTKLEPSRFEYNKELKRLVEIEPKDENNVISYVLIGNRRLTVYFNAVPWYEVINKIDEPIVFPVG